MSEAEEAEKEPAKERLNRYLARRGVAARRGADSLIASGRVAVNHVTADLGTTVDPDNDVVTVDGREIATSPVRTTLMLNKPRGVISTVRDTHHRPTVMDLAPSMPGLVPVGRLDEDSRGLLLLTTDGDLAHRLTHPRFEIAKTYHVTTERAAGARQLAQLREGLMLDDGFARPLAVDTVAHAGDHVLEVVMGEGRKREVRRLFAAVSLDVRDLRRVGFGPLRLLGVKEGESRELSADELAALYAAVELKAP